MSGNSDVRPREFVRLFCAKCRSFGLLSGNVCYEVGRDSAARAARCPRSAASERRVRRVRGAALHRRSVLMVGFSSGNTS